MEVAIVSDMFCDDTDCKVLTLIACRKRTVMTQDSNADVCWGDCDHDVLRLSNSNSSKRLRFVYRSHTKNYRPSQQLSV